MALYELYIIQAELLKGDYMATKGKPKYNYIQADKVQDQVLQSVNKYLVELGYNSMGIDDSNPKKIRTISHNELNYIFRQVNKDLFKPSKPMFNNQKSLINYDDVELIERIADVFIDISLKLNKSMGLLSFGYLCGIDYTTLLRWVECPELNLERSKVIKRLQESHKGEQVAMLNDSPVGALAVANNDKETGLNWSINQLTQQANNTIYILPSERLKQLGISDQQPQLEQVQEEE